MKSSVDTGDLFFLDQLDKVKNTLSIPIILKTW